MQKPVTYLLILLLSVLFMSCGSVEKSPEGFYTLDQVNRDKVYPDEIESTIEFRKDGTCTVMQDGTEATGHWKINEAGNPVITTENGRSLEMAGFSLQETAFSYVSNGDTLTFLKKKSNL